MVAEEVFTILGTEPIVDQLKHSMRPTFYCPTRRVSLVNHWVEQTPLEFSLYTPQPATSSEGRTSSIFSIN